MKKLLTVSLVAVMAVSAAHADIASTNYVDARTTEVSFTDTNYLNAETGLEAAVKALDAQLGTVTGTAGAAVTVTDFNQFKTDNTNAIATAKSEAITDAEGKVNALANGAVKTNADAIATLNANDQTPGSVDYKIKAATEDIKASQDTISGEVAQNEQAIGALDSSVTDLDGRVTVLEGVDNFTQAEFDTFSTANTTAIGNAKSEAIEAAAADATSKVNTLADGAVKDNTDAIADMGAAKQDKSNVEYALGTGAGNWINLMTSLPTACSTGNGTCTLVAQNGKMYWEVVAGGTTVEAAAEIKATAAQN